MSKKSVYQNAPINTTIFLFALSAMMIGFSIYLTGHYFNLKYPTGLETGTLCNFSSIFNCDNTTMSPASNIAGVPISIFGIIVGIFVMAGLFFKNEKFEKTLYFTLIINMIGCVGLFFYSLIALGGLCPFCTLYYIMSGLALWMFYKKSETPMPNIPVLVAFGVVFLAAAGLTRLNINSRSTENDAIAKDLIRQYYELPNLGAPTPASEFKIAHSEQPIIKVQIFSDYECPACKSLSDLMPAISKRYAGKIEIQYYFYPLDNNCNPSMQRPMHQQACRGAYATVCLGADKFIETHDEIFHNQHRLSSHLDKVIKDNKIEECVKAPETKEKVVALINASNAFNVRSTPTFLLNGVKIEGVLPLDQMYVIMDEIVRRAK